MDVDDPQGLLSSVLGFFAFRRPERPIKKPVSVKARKREAKSWKREVWLQTDAFLEYDNKDEHGKRDPEDVDRTLRAFDGVIECGSDGESDTVTAWTSQQNVRYPKLQAVRRSMIERPSHDPGSNTGNTIHVNKRKLKRGYDALSEQLSHMDREAKKHRVVSREEPDAGDGLETSDADFAVSMRRHLMYLDNALRNHWICECRQCAGLSVRLPLPQQKKDSEAETSFEVFFGVRSLPAHTLQEATITVKDAPMRRASEPLASDTSEFARICETIRESLHERISLHFSLEDGSFQKLRPQPKTFGGDQMSRTVSLSDLFRRQQELRGSSSVLPLKGKRILAVTLAAALLPFLETPWLQPSFNHSKIQFFEPRQDGELPDITKPFLAMEHIPIARRTDAKTISDSSKHTVHPNTSVLALGILLCELHHCTPVAEMQKDSSAVRDANADFYTCLDMLKTLEDDAGTDYYLATKACLQWEYYPPGKQIEFESVSVQRLFYQKVVKRLEAAIFTQWGLRLENLGSLSRDQNETCWGTIGREVIRQQTSQANSPDPNNEARVVPHRSMSEGTAVNHTSLDSGRDPVLRAQTTPGVQFRAPFNAEPVARELYFFDASHQTGQEQESPLSQQWMDNLLSSIYRHVDSFDTIEAERQTFEPVRIAILDSGFDRYNPLLMTDDQRLDPRIKDARSFVHQTGPHEFQDDFGHGTHALGLLLKVAPCAEIYIGRIAQRETLDRGTYDDIAKAINYAVSEWKVDIISMSFGIREYNEAMETAIANATANRTLLFAAASNDGANFGRAFPAKYPSVFCIHSTDGNGNPSKFNPTAHDKDVNFSLLGEQVSSHWPASKNGPHGPVNVLSGTSVATPIAAGLAASVLSFVRQQDQHAAPGDDLIGSWLKGHNAMDAVLQSMVKQRRGVGYDYITPHLLFDSQSPRDHVYNKIKDIKRHMYQ